MREAFVVCREWRPTLSPVLRRGAARVIPPTSAPFVVFSIGPLGAAFTDAENMEAGYELDMGMVVLWFVANNVGLEVCPADRVCLIAIPFMPLVSIAVELEEVVVAECRSQVLLLSTIIASVEDEPLERLFREARASVFSCSCSIRYFSSNSCCSLINFCSQLKRYASLLLNTSSAFRNVSSFAF